jgi:polysaccharide export outer membrane protein
MLAMILRSVCWAMQGSCVPGSAWGQGRPRLKMKILGSIGILVSATCASAPLAWSQVVATSATPTAAIASPIGDGRATTGAAAVNMDWPLTSSAADGSSPPLHVSPPPQMIGLSSGACQPCYRGIDCADSGGQEQRWQDVGPLPLDPLRHGEYVGPVRLPAMLEYRGRVGDEFQFIYVLTREESGHEYQLMVGDEILVESVTDAEIKRGDLTRGVQIQADGTVVLRLVGSIQAAGKTITQLRKDIEQAYATYLKNPSIDVTPVKTNTRLEDLRQAVSNLIGNNGGQTVLASINPDGRLQLPLIGSVYVVGMTLEEMKREINLRYRDRVIGIEVEPRLLQQAPSFVYVFGQVNKPGRYEISSPTTVTQALAMAEGLQIGANNRQIVVFRRAEDWRLLSTMLDLRGAHLGKRPNPADEIWLRDNDLIIVPPRPIKVFNDFVKQVFSDGLYPMIPPGLNYSIPNGEGNSVVIP